jgi:hypothetical protein
MLRGSTVLMQCRLTAGQGLFGNQRRHHSTSSADCSLTNLPSEPTTKLIALSFALGSKCSTAPRSRSSWSLLWVQLTPPLLDSVQQVVIKRANLLAAVAIIGIGSVGRNFDGFKSEAISICDLCVPLPNSFVAGEPLCVRIGPGHAVRRDMWLGKNLPPVKSNGSNDPPARKEL